jgi:hypothetical protein
VTIDLRDEIGDCCEVDSKDDFNLELDEEDMCNMNIRD